MSEKVLRYNQLVVCPCMWTLDKSVGALNGFHLPLKLKAAIFDHPRQDLYKYHERSWLARDTVVIVTLCLFMVLILYSLFELFICFEVLT